IAAPVEKVFAYYANMENQVEIWPSLVEVRDMQYDEQGCPTTYEWTYKMAGMRFDGTGRITEYEPNRRFAGESKGGIDSYIQVTFEGRGATTLVPEEVESALPHTLPGRRARGGRVRQPEHPPRPLRRTVPDAHQRERARDHPPQPQGEDGGGAVDAPPCRYALDTGGAVPVRLVLCGHDVLAGHTKHRRDKQVGPIEHWGPTSRGLQVGCRQHDGEGPSTSQLEAP